MLIKRINIIVMVFLFSANTTLIGSGYIMHWMYDHFSKTTPRTCNKQKKDKDHFLPKSNTPKNKKSFVKKCFQLFQCKKTRNESM